MANKPGAVYYAHSPRTHPLLQSYPNQLRTWTASYNPNLIGQDVLPTGEIHTSRPPPVYWYREWTQTPIGPRTFIPPLPFNQFDWPVPRPKPPQPPSWTWDYNRNLIGKDAFPAGEIFSDRPLPRIWYREWTQSLNNTTLSPVTTLPFNQDDWPLPGWALQPNRSYALSYNLTLDGQDDIGIRHLWNIAQGHQYQKDRAYRNWSQALVNTTLAPTAAPFSQDDWPLPRGPLQPDRFYAWRYNLNLIGQDQLPTGDIRDALVPRGFPPQVPSWAAWYNLNLIGRDVLPAGEIRAERPPPVSWYRDWSSNLLQTTLSVVVVPFNQFDWPNPRDHRRVTPSWTWQYNLNLVAQDQLPSGEISTDRKPVPGWYRDWAQNLLESTLFGGSPFYQTDWPLPGRNPPVVPSWAAWYNLNLIGKDRLPVGTQVDDRPPPVTWYRDWSLSLVNSTLVVVFNLPFNQYDWPNPRDYLRVTPSWARWFELNLVAQDVFPPGTIRMDLPVRLTWFQDWSQNLLNTPFTVTPVPPVVPPTPVEEVPPGSGVWREISHRVYGKAWKDAYRRELERLGLPPPPEDIPEPADFDAAIQEIPVPSDLPAYTPQGIEAEERYEALRATQVELIRRKAREVAEIRARALIDAQNAAWLLLMGD